MMDQSDRAALNNEGSIFVRRFEKPDYMIQVGRKEAGLRQDATHYSISTGPLL